MALSGTGLALATAGGVILWAGLAGVSPLSIVKSIGSGKQPASPDVNSLLSGLAQQVEGTFAQALASAGSGLFTGGT
jgi:hypothetical protein